MEESPQPADRRSARQRVLTGFDVAMALAAAAAIAALALELGFYELPGGVSSWGLHIVEGLALAVFVLNRFAHLALQTDRRRFLQENWIDFAMMLAAGGFAVAVVSEELNFRVLPAAAVYVIIIQVYVLAALVVRMVQFQFKVAESGIHPAWTMIGSFAVVILFGAGLLMLPKAAPPESPLCLTILDRLPGPAYSNTLSIKVRTSNRSWSPSSSMSPAQSS